VPFIIYLILISMSYSWAQNSPHPDIEAIDQEILKTQKSIGLNSGPEVYDKLKDLTAERERLQKLSKVKKDKPTHDLEHDPSVHKTLPQAVMKKVDASNERTEEAVPLNKKHDLILKDISTTRAVLINLKSQPNHSEAVQHFIRETESKLEILEKTKLDYEIQLSELEDVEYAEFKKSSLRVGAMLDFYYQYDSNRPDPTNPLPNRNYNRRTNDFTLNLIELNVHKSFKNLDMYADLDFGDFAEQNSAHASDPNTHHIGQAFLRYSIPNTENLTLTAGKFYSHVGYEVAKSIDNKNYSRPYSFTRGIPFWHEGVSLYKSGLGPFGVGLYIYDKTDSAQENNTGKDYGTQISFLQGNITSYFNFITGAETPKEGNMRTIYEYNLSWNPDRIWSYAMDVTYGSEKNATTDSKNTRWLGLVGYVDYNLFRKDHICFRVENFKDMTDKNASSNLFTSTNSAITSPANIMSYTLTNRYNMRNGSEIRFEWRTDKANQDIYPRKDAKFTDTQNTLTVAWLYAI
jgi:hypothetical protein